MADNIALRKYTGMLVKATFENKTPDIVPAGISESELVEIALKGQIPYLLLQSLLKVTKEEGVANRIRNLVKRSTFKTFLQVNIARQITAAFEENGIRHQILKGTIMKSLYPSPEMREMSDIDLVVYDDSLDKAAEVMEKLGFTNHGLVKHHMIFSKGNELLIEVHWCLFDASTDKKQYMYFKDNFRSKLVDGTNYTYEFGIEDFYVYMISHMAKHFFETGCGIRNLVDIYVYYNKYAKSFDQVYLNKELANCGILDFEKNMRELAYIWLDGKECEPYYDNLFEYMVDSGIYGKSENGVWGQLAKETAKGQTHSKLRFYFPSIEFMKEKYSWLNKYPVLLPVGWIIRGFSGISSKEARNHKDMIENSGEEHMKKMLDIYHRLNLEFRR